MRQFGERRPTHRAPLPGAWLAPSLAANAGSLLGILPFATLAPFVNAGPRCASRARGKGEAGWGGLWHNLRLDSLLRR